MRGARWVITLALVLTPACSDDGGGADEPATTASTAPTPTLEGDGSVFCDSMLAVGRVQGAAGATPEEVLETNERLVRHLGEAQASAPGDAPTDFDALLDDYRVATDAIFEADGDVAEAFEALGQDHPDVVRRLGSPTSHAEAYEFLLDRCGEAALPGEG